MNILKQLQNLAFLLFSTTALFGANASHSIAKTSNKTVNICKPLGWSVDVGGAYTWIDFSTPPTYSGNTGGVHLKVTYQKPFSFFGQARTFYNLGPLSSSLNQSGYSEWYPEFVGGYSLSAWENWIITPYAGLGLEFLYEGLSSYGSTASTHLQYNIYYAIAGFDTRYIWADWTLGLQIDCLPTFNQYLKIRGLSEAAWTLPNRVGAAVRIPVAYRYAKNFWLELTPYFRFLPLGASNMLSLPERNLHQWGAFLTFRFFL